MPQENICKDCREKEQIPPPDNMQIKRTDKPIKCSRCGEYYFET